MEAAACQTQNSSRFGRSRRKAGLKFATIGTTLVCILVFLVEFQRERFGFSVGPWLPPSKVRPQLFNTLGVSALLAPDGSLWCWTGTNEVIRTGLIEDLTVAPQRIGSASDWQALAASYAHALAIKADGSLWGWGVLPSLEQHLSTPTRIGTDCDWAQVAVGVRHCLALKNDGSLWSWGRNDHGQVGNGTLLNQPAPVRIGPDNDWKTIACAHQNSFALKQDGTVFGWGYSPGQGSGDDLSPRAIDFGGKVLSISANDYLLLALRSDGTMWIYGANAASTAASYLNSFHGSARTGWRVGNDKDWGEVYAGTRFFFARKRDGSWWVCGECEGIPTNVDLPEFAWFNRPQLGSPKRFPLRFEAWAIAPGLGSALVLTKDGALWTFDIRPEVNRLASMEAKLKARLNRIVGALPGHAQPFNLKRFRINPHPHRLWQLPPSHGSQSEKPDNGVQPRA